jgi:multidrug efflux pump subunit AcrB
VESFLELLIVLGISATAIYLALVFQFKHAIKPFVVFAAIPYGMVGALVALWVMGAPFGFMAFLGIISLVGVLLCCSTLLRRRTNGVKRCTRPCSMLALCACGPS